MTGSRISNLFSGAGGVQGQNMAQNTQNGQGSKTGDVFGAFLGQATMAFQGTGGMADMILPQNNAGAPQAVTSYDKIQSAADYRGITQTEAKQPQLPQNVTEEVEESLGQWKEKVTDLLTDELKVTEEELLEAMEVLGVTFEDLLAGKGLNELVAELTGVEDMTELLFSDTLQTLTQGIGDLTQELADQLGLTQEQMEAAIQQAMEQMSQEQPELAVDAPEESNATIVEETVGEIGADSSQGKAAGMFADTDAEVEVRVEVQEEVRQPELPQQAADAQSDGSEELLGKQEQPKESKNVSEDHSQAPQMTYQTVQTTVNAAGQEVVQVTQQAFVDTQDIIRQISEYTRVAVSPAESTIEMQLNPANLGKLYLQVVSRQGVITAQLAAQNEAVKQALESQLTVLRENMSQQGLKVEAVEVTVASHEFEQNLEKGSEQANQQAQEESRKTRRFISADQLDDLAGTMTEEEALAAQIMLDNGNSVDMTA